MKTIQAAKSIWLVLSEKAFFPLGKNQVSSKMFGWQRQDTRNGQEGSIYVRISYTCNLLVKPRSKSSRH